MGLSAPTEMFTMDRMAEVAALPVAQYVTAHRVLVEVFGFGSRGPTNRGCLVLWNALAPVQRQIAQGKSGLSYRFLRPDLKRLFELASTGKLETPDTVLSRQDREWPPDDLLNASLFVIADEHEMWGLRTGSGWETSVGTREKVFEQIRRRNAGVTIDNLERAVSTDARFRFASPGGFEIEHRVNLPVRWFPPKNPQDQ